MDTSGSVDYKVSVKRVWYKKKTCLAINVNKWQMYHNAAVWPQRVKKEVEVGQLIYLLERWGGGGGGLITVTTRTSRRPPPTSPQSLLKINTCSICTQDISYSPRLSCKHNYYISPVQLFIFFYIWVKAILLLLTCTGVAAACVKGFILNNLNQAKKEIQRLAFQHLTPTSVGLGPLLGSPPPLLDLDRSWAHPHLCWTWTAPGLLPPAAPSASPGSEELCRALLGVKTAPEQKHLLVHEPLFIVEHLEILNSLTHRYEGQHDVRTNLPRGPLMKFVNDVEI